MATVSKKKVSKRKSKQVPEPEQVDQRELRPLDIDEIRRECVKHFDEMIHDNDLRSRGLKLFRQYIAKLRADDEKWALLANDPWLRCQCCDDLVLPDNHHFRGGWIEAREERRINYYLLTVLENVHDLDEDSDADYTFREWVEALALPDWTDEEGA